ncbi:MAG: hypothetical protein FWC91_12275 [Defluviitaleaceae bacterium]|nr:hypothetical protein [Defluviitaleaceae bacterium]
MENKKRALKRTTTTDDKKVFRTNKKAFMKKAAALTLGITMLAASFSPTTAYARHPGFGDGHGRTAPVNVNDFATPVWERFSFNYTFHSGADFRYELGRPTTFNGTVPANVFTANMRRNAGVSLLPPSYGIFSGKLPTMPGNPLFQQPANPHFAMPWETTNPNALTTFDTLQQGANLQSQGNPMNMFNVDSSGSNVQGTGGFLQSTSIGIAN